MSKFRIVCAIFVFIASVYLVYRIDSNWVVTLSSFLGVLAVIGFILKFWGINGFMIGCCISTGVVVIGSPVRFINNIDVAQNAVLMNFFMDAHAGLLGPISSNGKDIALHGLRLCAMQPYRDSMELAMDLQKALYLDPITSIVLDASIFSKYEPSKDTCMKALVSLHRYHPELTSPLINQYLD